jgi:hypothetical protein
VFGTGLSSKFTAIQDPSSYRVVIL